MKIIVRIFNVIVCGVILVGCSDNHDIEEKISSLQSQPIKLCLDEMRCRNKYGDTIVVDSVKPLYRMVVYVDSSACSPYTLDKMFVWNESIKKARRQDSMLKYVFIVAPKPSEMDDINLELSITDLKSSIYLDTAYIFRKENPSIPSDRKYHSFLLDKNGKICFVGSPIDNEKIKAIYGKTIGLKQ